VCHPLYASQPRLQKFSIKKACQREAEAVKKQLLHWQAKRFEPPSQAQQALSELANQWRYPQGQAYELIDHKRYAQKGRPMADTPLKAIEWQMQAQVRPDTERLGVCP
jgi:hypothetical protein